MFLKEAEPFFQIIIGAILGFLIGWDRSIKKLPAGIKTYTFISVSCTLLTLISIHSVEKYSISGQTMMDPMRLAAQIVSGLGFIGAGVIIKSGFRIKGLTSAAMMFFAGTVGIGIGSGYYLITIFSVLIMLGATYLGNKFEHETGSQK